MPDAHDATPLDRRDAALVSAIAEHTTWGSRGEAERRAFLARLEARRARRTRATWMWPALASAVATAAVVAAVWLPSGDVADPASGTALAEARGHVAPGGFLSAAYYGHALSDAADGSIRGYWTLDDRPWADAPDAGESRTF